MNYEAQGVHFDGANDYLTRGADLTGNADSKKITGSFWLRTHDLIGFRPLYLCGATTQFQITRQVGGEIRIRGKNSSNTTILLCDSGLGTIVEDTWHHVMFSFDLTDTAKRHMYVDGVSQLEVTTYTNDTIDLTHSEHLIGLTSTGLGDYYDGDLADFYLNFAEYLDLSVQANGDKFYLNGSPVDLGSDGSTPTGTAPIIYLSGDVSTWHTNDGTGGGFTENGALTAASTNPPVLRAIGPGLLSGIKLQRPRLVA